MAAALPSPAAARVMMVMSAIMHRTVPVRHSPSAEPAVSAEGTEEAEGIDPRPPVSVIRAGERAEKEGQYKYKDDETEHFDSPFAGGYCTGFAVIKKTGLLSRRWSYKSLASYA